MASAACVSQDNFRNLPWLSFPPDLDSPSNDSDFEFSLHHFNPLTVLPADQLFLDGKLLPKQPLTTPSTPTSTAPQRNDNDNNNNDNKFSSVETIHKPEDTFSPRAPKCSSRWRDILGFKNKKHLLKKNPKPTTSTQDTATSLTLPLLHRNSDSSLLDTSSSSSQRLSLSSSSSSAHDHDDLPLPPPRFSLDEKPRIHLIRPKPVPGPDPNPKPLIDHPTANVVAPIRRGHQQGMSVDSPRMNHAGKIVFQSLGRSSSSPSSFNNGPRYKYKGMERSYSANVRVTPVLNVPICSLRGSSSKSGGFGFGHLFSSSSSSQKKDKDGSNNSNSSSNNNNNNNNGGGIGGSSRNYHLHNKKESS